MTRLRLLTVGLGLAAATGCGHSTAPPPGTDGGTVHCEVRADCGDAGQICTQDKYCAGCDSSGQCQLKEVCDPAARRCAFRAGWGAQCQKNSDCQAGQWCVQGLCKARADAFLCPDGVNAQCPQGKRCNALNLVCEEDLGCLQTADCDPGEACNLGAHACVPACTAATAARVCLPNQVCANSICAQCSKPSDCAVGLVCDTAGNCSTGQRCYLDRDCTLPLVCYAPTGACVSRLPPCVSDENCTATFRCNIATGSCVPRACQPDRFEPNHTLATAFGITASRYTGLSLCSNETDYFAIQLGRGDQLGINVDADPFAEATYTTSILDGSGRVLASGRLLTSFVAALPGTYYVALHSTDPYQLYDLNVLLSRGTPCDDDVFEPNDFPAQAIALNATLSVDAVVCPQDKDYFSLQVAGGKALTASLVNYNSTNGLLQLCVLDALDDGGTALIGCAQDLGSPAVTRAAAPDAGQKVLLLVQGTTPAIANSYTLQAVLR